MKNEQYWKVRAERYDNLQWVTEDEYIQKILKSAAPHKTDVALDVGCGSGVISDAISPFVKEVIGLDISPDMLKHNLYCNNKYFIRGDIRETLFAENVFDIIIARMVFHHILTGTPKAMKECYDILKPGGHLIIAEGVPPHNLLKKDYVRIFKLKEKRIVFTAQDLIDLMKKAGFKNIAIVRHITKNFSVKNWLENSGLAKITQRKIYRMHIGASSFFKEKYNLKITQNDCLIDCHTIIIRGEKSGKGFSK